MTRAASKLLTFIRPEATAVAVRTSSGEPCCEAAIEQLSILVANNHVVGILRGTNVRQMEMTKPVVLTHVVGDPRVLIDPLAYVVQSSRTPGPMFGRQRCWAIGCTCPRTP